MYRKIVWCYIIVLTLLDISLNTKLTALGKSHGVSVHDSLVEGITFQEWGKDPPAGAEAGGALRLAPPALALGPRALGAAHAATVTLTNTANTTLHLASVAGTTPDFHASFFDAKTLPPDGNTTFSVVYLGRREGPAAAHLYIHTSLGVYKYSVSAEGVASEWGLWPLLALRVPLNASVASALALRNPTAHPVQVTSVYSSGSWVRLSLPGGAASLPRGAWLVPPHSTKDIVILDIQPASPHASTAYVRIKANISGDAWVVGVEARGAPPGEWLQPLQLRLRPRGHADPADTFTISLASSAGAGARLEGGVWGARCTARPTHSDAEPTHRANGVKAPGATVALLKAYVEPYQELTRAAELTLDYEKLWAGYAEGGGGGDSAWCSGVLRLGRAALPYSVRLLRGTLRWSPAALQFVTSAPGVLQEVAVAAHNEFSAPVEVTHVSAPEEHFIVTMGAKVIPAGASAVVARLRLRRVAGAALAAALRVRTNVTEHALPLAVFSGRPHLEWVWPGWAGGSELWLGALGASSTRRVQARVHNRGPARLCVRPARLTLPGASFALLPDPRAANQSCIEPWSWRFAALTVVAPARAGPLSGALWLSSAHAAAGARVAALVAPGRLAAAPSRPAAAAAPYAWSLTPLVVESSMALRMRVVRVEAPPLEAPDPALEYIPPESEAEWEISAGRRAVGGLQYAPERACAPHCYTGLDLDTPEGAEWVRGAADPAAARAQDLSLLAARRDLFGRRVRTVNISLVMQTSEVLQVPISGSVRLVWPRVAAAGGGAAGLAAVGGAGRLALRLRNPSRSHALLLQPALGPPPPPRDPAADHLWEEDEESACSGERGSYVEDAFSLDGWGAEWGAGGDGAREWEGAPEVKAGAKALAMVVVAPGAELRLRLTFSPPAPAPLAAVLYLRNNLTILEGVRLCGRGALPAFELGGRRPGAGAPLLFEVTECGVVRRTVSARNTGAVAVRLAGWALAGRACAGRGFALEPCAQLMLAPNASAPLALSFAPDHTLARAQAALVVRSDRARHSFRLQATAAPALLRQCAARAPRPPFEPALHSAGLLLALVGLVLVLAAAGLDAERLLRRCRARAAPPAPAAPLDLRAVCAPPPPPAPASAAAPAPRAPPPRRRRRPKDALAESRAFERWRAALRHPDDDDSRSSEDAEPAAAPPARPAPPAPRPPAPPSSGDEAASERATDSDSSSPPEPDSEERPEPAPQPAPPPEQAAPEDPPRAPSPRRRPPRERRADADPPRPARPLPAKHHARKDKPSKRRERAPPPAAPPAPPSPRPSPAPPPPSPPAAVRWGASWSSVVAQGGAPAAAAPAPPHAPAAPRADHSLFYFNGEQAREADYAWRADPAPAPPPAPAPAPAFHVTQPSREFLGVSDEPVKPVGAVGAVGGGGGFARGVWGASLEARAPGAAWPWPPAYTNTASVRPPPGFGSTPSGSNPVGPVGSAVSAVGPVGSPVGPVGSGGAPRGVRPFDPFHSLAAIWSRTALDWRSESADENN